MLCRYNAVHWSRRMDLHRIMVDRYCMTTHEGTRTPQVIHTFSHFLWLSGKCSHSDRTDSFSRVQPNAKSICSHQSTVCFMQNTFKNTQDFIDLKTDCSGQQAHLIDKQWQNSHLNPESGALGLSRKLCKSDQRLGQPLGGARGPQTKPQVSLGEITQDRGVGPSTQHGWATSVFCTVVAWDEAGS